MIDKYNHLINRYHYRFMDDHLGPTGLSGPSGGPLMEIYRHRSVKMNALNAAFPFHKSHITRVVQSLCEAGFVEKTVDPDDARGFILTITEAGIKGARSVEEAHEEWEKLIATALTEEEQNTYRRITKKVYLKVAEYYAEEPDEETL